MLKQLIVSCSLLLISMSASAQQWYHVELIVFEQLNTITDEQWPMMPATANKASLTPFMANKSIQAAQRETLVGSASRLNRSSAYRVHYHQAWQQPINKKRSAKAVQIHSPNNMINGSIRLYKSTYLHAAVNLWLMENTASTNEWTEISADDTILSGIRNPNLVESRRIRSKKPYFFDHPKLGALLKITPIDTPAAMQQSAQTLETYSLPTEASPTLAE